HFYLGARGAEPVPLNWVLSSGMARHVWLSAGNGDPGREAHDVFVRANRCEAARLAGTVRREAIMPVSCAGLPGFGTVANGPAPLPVVAAPPAP
ncbi:hypothetical protein, partial [Stenotrophomonas sp. A3_2]|uniref:hypothetical protein n=1 Tax=Stenotrophomonas sp. A3_2 TaxID=3119978 RepID=UPI002FC28A3B